MLKDFDPQGSSIDWLRQRRGNLPKIIGLEASEKFPKLSSTVDVVVMDAPSRTHDEQIVSLLSITETCIVPVVPSRWISERHRDFLGN